jgi:serine/threonine-protein kinase
MNPERWQQVRRIFEDAVEQPSAERLAFLDAACGADAELRREVEALLAACDTADDFLAAPPRQLATEVLAAQPFARSTLNPGQKLDHYEVVSLLGKGGMGEVYLAQDQRLGRQVALKVLPAAYTNDRARVRRFTQEARAASALNHPNIAMIFDLGEADCGHFIAMEFVEGQTLRAHLAQEEQRGLKLTEVLEIAAQMAAALAAAHQAGVVHRDIKPENVMLRPDGFVKVLDFGLAKLTELRDATHSALRTQHSGTAPGTVLGTISYMSPEQARGQEVDARSDLFSLGIVLYELATGRLPFDGATPSDVLAAILQNEPPSLTELTPSPPAEFQRIVTRALRKERDERYQTADALLHDLRALQHSLAWQTEQGATALLPGAATNEFPAAGAQSSAEYLVKEIKRHKLALSAGLLALTLIAALVYLFVARYARPPGAAIKSLAVLPLANVSGLPEQEYFSDGLTEALITDLARLGALRVISRTSAMQYKGVRKALPQVARELDVEAVLEGSVTRAGDRVRITAQLIHAPSETPLWAQSYERDARDTLALQREVARDIVTNISLKLTPEEQRQFADARPVNPAAYEAYLQGRFHWNKRAADGLDMAITYFQDALRLAPDYAMAHAGLADSYLLLTPYRNVPAAQSYPQAKEAAERALQLDSQLAAAHASLGVVKHEYDWDWAGAEQAFQRALELNPNYATAHQWYAELLTRLGRKTEARAEIERALASDPLSLIVNSVSGWVYLNSREPERALEQLRKTLALDANFIPAHGYLGLAHQQLGQYPQALAEFRRALELSGGSPRYLANLGVAQALAGQADAARQTLAELLRRNAQQRVQPFHLASVYTALGQHEQAFAWLELAFQERGVWLLFLHLDPLFDRLRPDARYADMLARLKLPH